MPGPGPTKPAEAHCVRAAHGIADEIMKQSTAPFLLGNPSKEGPIPGVKHVRLYFHDAQTKEDFVRIKAAVRRLLRRRGFELIHEDRTEPLAELHAGDADAKTRQIVDQFMGLLRQMQREGPEERDAMYVHPRHRVAVRLQTQKTSFGKPWTLHIAFSYGLPTQEGWQPLGGVPRATEALCSHFEPFSQPK